MTGKTLSQTEDLILRHEILLEQPCIILIFNLLFNI